MQIQRENPLDSFGHEEPSYRRINPERKEKEKRIKEVQKPTSKNN